MKFTIPNIYFVILIGLLTFWLTFLTAKAGLTDNRIKGFLRKLTKRGRITAIILASITALLFGQECNNQKISYNNALLLTKERNERDSAITEGINMGVDSASNKLFNDISVAFSKQELRLDTLNQIIVKFEKGVMQTSAIQSHPVIYIDSVGFTLKRRSANYVKYEIEIGTRDAGATNFNINFELLFEYKENLFAKSTSEYLPVDLKLSLESSFTTGFTSIDADNKSLQNIYIFLTGSYTTLDGNQSYPINDLYLYRLDIDRVSVVTKYEKKRILEIMEKLPDNGSKLKL